MLQVKIIDTEDLYLQDEENAINNGIQKLMSEDTDKLRVIIRIVYRQNSTILEYEEYSRYPETDCSYECADICESYQPLH